MGVLERWYCEELDAGVERAFRAALDALGRAGAVLAPADTGWQDDPNVLRDIYNCEPVPCYADGVRADPAPYEPFVVQDLADGRGDADPAVPGDALPPGRRARPRERARGRLGRAGLPDGADSAAADRRARPDATP